MALLMGPLYHLTDSGDSRYFTTAHFHRARDLASEIAQAGLAVETVLAVEGFANYMSGIEAEGTMLGASSHLIAIARRKR
jgi:hypothetical protein